MHQAMLHAESTSDARNKPKTCRAATSAPHAPSTSGTQSGREPARQLHARTPDLRANHTRGSRCPRRCAPCSWTRRCARALSCDRRSTGSASARTGTLTYYTHIFVQSSVASVFVRFCFTPSVSEHVSRSNVVPDEARPLPTGTHHSRSRLRGENVHAAQGKPRDFGL